MQTRYKRDWKPSQWSSYSPVTADFNCCRHCDVGCFILQSADDGGEAKCKCRSQEALIHKLLDSIATLQMVDPKSWTRFCATLNERDRSSKLWLHANRFHGTTQSSWLKIFSYYGSIDCCYFVSQHRDAFGIDVGNWLMAWFFRMCWPMSELTSDLNDEHLADVLEAFMGMIYWKKRLDQPLNEAVMQILALISGGLAVAHDLYRSGFQGFAELG